MGDRCYYRADVPRKHFTRFMKIMLGEEWESAEAYITYHENRYGGVKYGKHTISIEIEEMNYGGYDDMLLAASQGLEFRGWHGFGGSYPAGVFVGIGGQFYEMPDLDGPVVSVAVVVDEEGQATVSISDNCLKDAKQYYEAEWRWRNLYPTEDA